MIFTYNIIPEKNLIVERFEGIVTYELLTSALQHIWSDSRYDGSYDGIVDFSDTSFDMDQHEVYQIAVMLSKIDRGPGGKMVICVSKPVETALIYLFEEKMSARMGVSVFSTLDGACSFLNVDKDILDHLASNDAIQINYEDLSDNNQNIQRSSR